MVLKTRSCSRLTTLSSSSPSDAMALVDVLGDFSLGLARVSIDKQEALVPRPVGMRWQRSAGWGPEYGRGSIEE